MKEIPFTEYKKLKPIAQKIYNELYGKPKTHQEWANSFNLIGRIIRKIKEEIHHEAWHVEEDRLQAMQDDFRGWERTNKLMVNLSE